MSYLACLDCGKAAVPLDAEHYCADCGAVGVHRKLRSTASKRQRYQKSASGAYQVYCSKCRGPHVYKHGRK